LRVHHKAGPGVSTAIPSGLKVPTLNPKGRHSATQGDSVAYLEPGRAPTAKGAPQGHGHSRKSIRVMIPSRTENRYSPLLAGRALRHGVLARIQTELGIRTNTRGEIRKTAVFRLRPSRQSTPITRAREIPTVSQGAGLAEWRVVRSDGMRWGTFPPTDAARNLRSPFWDALEVNRPLGDGMHPRFLPSPDRRTSGYTASVFRGGGWGVDFRRRLRYPRGWPHCPSLTNCTNSSREKRQLWVTVVVIWY